ncbi:uncharacterized protein LOC135960308 [Calliphora vicina]|uniref:uncharacterized protein LOC135960308 n=1 Tax=Calliphora vicina TaxID=7373 RepID=UPI00325BBEB5
MDNSQTARVLIALKQLKELMDISDEEFKKERRVWVIPSLAKRNPHSLEAHLLEDNMINIDDFEKILGLVHLKIKKQDTVMRCAISPRVRLSVTLRYLATGDSLRSLECVSKISRKTISHFLPEVLNALIESLESEYLKLPSNEDEWLDVANGFEYLCEFPHTLGAMDGKHIRIKSPAQSGSNFFNKNGFYSKVLFAVVDANSKFLYVEIGGNGRGSDDEIFKNSTLYEAIKDEKLKLPSDRQLKGQTVKTPFYFVADDIFSLDRHVMKAYTNTNSNLSASQKLFNNRLSRARMSVEMAFDKLTTRFKILRRPIEVSLDTCDSLIKTCCILHNYLSKDMTEPYEMEITSPNLPETMTPLPPQCQDQVKLANKFRDNIRKYLVANGDDYCDN